jgi:CheY-like chemotaxis protein/anti-sigma regulatory factor (Ser/Thr protein kinase)
MNARLFRELERKGVELEIASRHKSEFLASMSHELRTPLNAVIGFSEVLLERMFGDLNERQEEYLRDIWESGRHLLELLNEILDLSKVEAGKMELEPTPVDVHAVLAEGITMVRELAASRGARLDLDVGEGVDTVTADLLRFKQVVLNLLSNAVKFAHHRIVVRARVDGSMLVVSVEDDGDGVPPADQERIFEAFQQGGRGVTKEQGTGLGLTLCRRIVELHGGQIWVESEVGRGSTFTFAVPTTPSVEPQPWISELEVRAPDVPIVVIVEDDRRSLELLTLYLQGAGAEVVTARDGQAGLGLVRRVQPAAIVLDIGLPKIDGWDLLALFKADPATANIPVVVVSMIDERAKGLALGASEYLVKPVERSAVRAALKRVVPV